MCKRFALVMSVCVLLLVSTAPAIAAPGPTCRVFNDWVPIRSIRPEEKQILVLIKECYAFPDDFSIYYWYTVTDSTIIKMAGQGGWATFEDLSTTGQVINYTYHVDEDGQAKADKISIRLLE